MTESDIPEEHRKQKLELPTSSVARPSELKTTGDEAITWWRPSWQDSVRLVGWRWIFLTPGLLVIGLLVASVICIPLRPVLLVVGAKLLIFVVAVTISMAGWVIRRASRARKEPFCIHCGYNLTGLPDDYRCPECGRPYNWRLIEEYRRDPQWFIERWKMHKQLPSSDRPFDAGSVRRGRSRDGT